MSNISCDVIKDLLPLYAEDIVSENSKQIIDAHLQTCSSCTDYYNMIKAEDIDHTAQNAAKDKTVIKKMRKAITQKRIITACITCVAVLAVAAAIFYFGFVREIYIPYEDIDLLYKPGRLETTLVGYHIYICEPEDSGIAFIYAGGSLYEQYVALKHVDSLNLVEEDHMSDINFFEYGEDYPIHFRIKEVYYVPKEYISKVRHVDEWNEGTLEELKSVSRLIWEAE